MCSVKLRPGDVEIDVATVRRLLSEQFPCWSTLSMTPAASTGTDNVMFRLGDDMAVRLPRRAESARHVDKEHQWMPRLAMQLPLAIPQPLGKCVPGAGYPFPWTVCQWREGDDLTAAPVTDLRCAAVDLGGFVAALRRADADAGPPSFRGGPLCERDRDVRAAIHGLKDSTLDTTTALQAWEEAVHTPPWTGPAVWVHGDLLPGNLLAVQGRISAVVDFGGLGVGDPACDMMPAWTVLSSETRAQFRLSAEVDDATWRRGRGWALCFGLVAWNYYRGRGHPLADVGSRTVHEVVKES